MLVTVATGVILYLTRDRNGGTNTVAPAVEEADAGEAVECCGRHAVCEKISGAPLADLYWDDEELDRFIRRAPDSYTPEETEEFRQVLYTLPEGDAYAWGMALTRRDIALPEELRDEWLMLTDNPQENQ